MLLVLCRNKPDWGWWNQIISIKRRTSECVCTDWAAGSVDTMLWHHTWECLCLDEMAVTASEAWTVPGHSWYWSFLQSRHIIACYAYFISRTADIAKKNKVTHAAFKAIFHFVGLRYAALWPSFEFKCFLMLFRFMYKYVHTEEMQELHLFLKTAHFV